MLSTLERNEGAATSDIDPFSREFLSDPYPFHEQLREAGPIVRLTPYNVWAVARYEQVVGVLNDWQTFCSGGGVGLQNFHKEPNWRPPSLLLETDPPVHDRVRAVVMRALSPVNLKKLRDGFYQEAVTLIDHALELGSFDAVKEITQPYPLKVFPDAIGLPEEDREKVLFFGDAVFNTIGPKNDLYEASLTRGGAQLPFIMELCQRRSLRPGSLGDEVYKGVERGEVTEDEAALLVRSFLSAGLDTTIHGLGSAILCFAENPDQWQALRQDRSKVRAAFEEVLRLESPFQAFFRTTTKATEIAGVPIEAEEKIYVSVAAANRDPRKWADPTRFDISRKTVGHVGFGYGIHNCIGQMIARIEIEMMLTAMVERVESIEFTGTPERLVHNTLRAATRLPVRMTPA